MPILNFNLQNVASAINQIISLYDPLPAFQFAEDANGNYIILDGSTAIRADGNGGPAVASAGFLASFNVPPLPPPNPPPAGVYPLPANSFSVNAPSYVYGSSVSPNDDSVYSVVQINSAVANIEPGFSRLRVDYTDVYNTTHTEYFDCPFYEGWDLTARELNQVVSYLQGGVNFLQHELDELRLELQYAMSRSLWRGLSVSGQVQVLPATQGLHTGPLTTTSLQPPYYVAPPMTPLNLAHGMEEKGYESPSDFLNYNYPGVVSNGNTVSAGFNASPNKASWAMTENTDGTLTLWVYDLEQAQGNIEFVQFSFAFSGPIDGSVAGYANSQLVATCYGPAHPNYPFWGISSGSPSSQLANYGNYPLIQGIANDALTDAAGNYIFRMRLKPTGGAGSVISLVNLEHFTSYNYSGSDNRVYQDGPYGNNYSGGTSLKLKGATPTNPTISSVSPNPMCVGNTVTVTGQNFDSTYSVYLNGAPVNNLTVVSPTMMTFIVPSGQAAGAATLKMSNTKYTTTYSVTVAPTPVISSVVDTDSSQSDQGAPGEHITISGSNFGATQGSGSLHIGTTTVTPTSWSDTKITAVIPSISGGTYQLQVSQGCATAARQFVVDTRAAVSGAPTLFINPSQLTLANSQVHQFFAYVLMQGETPQDVTDQCTWKVSGVQGGDATDGTISNLGYYTAPATNNSSRTVTVSATVTFEDSQNAQDPYNGTVLTASSTVTLEPPNVRQQPYATVKVVSQLNIFLGDGRAAYVPVSASINAYPGQYIYVQFEESIDPQTLQPIASNSDIQQLSMHTISALDPSVANVMYNLAGMTVDPVNHVLNTKRTIVLGIIDPSDGQWHSMWDIGIPPAPGADTDSVASPFAVSPFKSVPTTAYYAENLPAFTPGHEFEGSVIDYIDNLSGAQQKQLSALRRRSNTLVTGNCFYNEKTGVFEVLDQLTVFSINDDGRYKAVAIVEPQEVIIKQGQFLVIADNTLHVGKIGEKLDPTTVVVGVAMDRFYTQWPILPQYMVSLEDSV